MIAVILLAVWYVSSVSASFDCDPHGNAQFRAERCPLPVPSSPAPVFAVVRAPGDVTGRVVRFGVDMSRVLSNYGVCAKDAEDADACNRAALGMDR